MVKLRRVYEDEGVSTVDASSFPQKAIMYYGLKAESDQNEYQFYFTIYDRSLTPEKVIEKGKKPDHVFKSSKHGLAFNMQNSGFLTDKDFGLVNKLKDKSMRAEIGFVIEPLYTSTGKDWDYAKVFVNVDNQIVIEWRH